VQRGMLDRSIGLAVIVALWLLVAQQAGSLLASPLRVAAFAWHEAVSGALPLQVGVTLARVVTAFLIAMVSGSIIGYTMGRSPRVNAIADLPLLVVVILAYVWVGLNDYAAVLAVVVAKAPTVVVTVREGARTLDPALDEMAAVFCLPRRRRLRSIVVPQLAPYLAAAGRSGLSITWKIVLVVELLGRPNGVGFALNMFFQNFDVTGIMAYGIVFAVIMLLIEATILHPLERRANRWRSDAPRLH
jgi:NitT/TauT family transport system permease protein